MILDSEVYGIYNKTVRSLTIFSSNALTQVLMVDHKTGKPLPFGSLGIHKVMSEGESFVDW